MATSQATGTSSHWPTVSHLQCDSYARLLAEDKPEDHADRSGLEFIAGEADRIDPGHVPPFRN
jgi:hypothetical protein